MLTLWPRAVSSASEVKVSEVNIHIDANWAMVLTSSVTDLLVRSR